MSGFLRPNRSPTQPEAVAPIKRIHKVIVNTKVTAVIET